MALTLSTQTRSGPHVLDDKQRAQHLQFKIKHVKDLLPLRDCRRINDDDLLFRFLIAQKWDMVKAEAMLREYLAFRAKYRVDGLFELDDDSDTTPHDVSAAAAPSRRGAPPAVISPVTKIRLSTIPKEIRQQMAGFYSHDKQGHPVYYERPEPEVISNLVKKFDREEIIVWHLVVAELGRWKAKEHGTDRMTVVMDLQHISLGVLSNSTVVKMMKELSHIDQHCYPENMFTLCILNAPRSFSFMWKVVKPMLEERVQKKIQVLDDIKKLWVVIEEKEVPVEFGGKGLGWKTVDTEVEELMVAIREETEAVDDEEVLVEEEEEQEEEPQEGTEEVEGLEPHDGGVVNDDVHEGASSTEPKAANSTAPSEVREDTTTEIFNEEPPALESQPRSLNSTGVFVVDGKVGGGGVGEATQPPQVLMMASSTTEEPKTGGTSSPRRLSGPIVVTPAESNSPAGSVNARDGIKAAIGASLQSSDRRSSYPLASDSPASMTDSRQPGSRHATGPPSPAPSDQPMLPPPLEQLPSPQGASPRTSPPKAASPPKPLSKQASKAASPARTPQQGVSRSASPMMESPRLPPAHRKIGLKAVATTTRLALSMSRGNRVPPNKLDGIVQEEPPLPDCLAADAPSYGTSQPWRLAHQFTTRPLPMFCKVLRRPLQGLSGGAAIISTSGMIAGDPNAVYWSSCVLYIGALWDQLVLADQTTMAPMETVVIATQVASCMEYPGSKVPRALVQGILDDERAVLRTLAFSSTSTSGALPPATDADVTDELNESIHRRLMVIQRAGQSSHYYVLCPTLEERTQWLQWFWLCYPHTQLPPMTAPSTAVGSPAGSFTSSALASPHAGSPMMSPRSGSMGVPWAAGAHSVRAF